jgi:cysteine desulfurase
VERIYLDHNATTPLHEAVLEEMLPYLQGRFGNPSSIHRDGQTARQALDLARQRVADFLGADPHEIIFTSGGTESNNLALHGTLAACTDRQQRIITSAVEHPAILNTCKLLESRGAQVTYLPVDGAGCVDPEMFAAAIDENISFVSVMLANNDVGTVQPVQQLAELSRQHGRPIHTDAIQAAGKLRIDVRELKVDLLSISSHKLYGPKGSGALFIRRGTELTPLFSGGAHEKGLRAGTENVPAIVGFGKACELAGNELDQRAYRMAELRDRLSQALQSNIDGVHIHADQRPRLPNTLSLAFDAVDAESLLLNLDLQGISASAGSACSAGSREPSYVLTAMGVRPEQALSSIRFSLGITTTDTEIDRTVSLLIDLVARLRGESIT